MCCPLAVEKFENNLRTWPSIYRVSLYPQVHIHRFNIRSYNALIFTIFKKWTHTVKTCDVGEYSKLILQKTICKLQTAEFVCQAEFKFSVKIWFSFDYYLVLLFLKNYFIFKNFKTTEKFNDSIMNTKYLSDTIQRNLILF